MRFKYGTRTAILLQCSRRILPGFPRVNIPTMRLSLFVPGLLLPGEVHSDTVGNLTAPSLALIAGRGQRCALAADWLAAAFGIAAALPAAALRKLGAGEAAQAAEPRKVEAAQAAEPQKVEAAHGEWLCLDPVHWQVTREGITLDDPARLALDATEAAALIAAIQPIFAEWGELSASGPARWELRLQRPLALDTRPLPAAIRQPVSPALPGGTDGRTWRRLLAEAQTVLHAHPVNREREATDRPTVNSLWPWGQGSLPGRSPTRFTAAWSSDPVVAGLCAHAGIPCLPPPASFRPADGNLLACIGTLAQPAHALDALAWREALLACERDWLAPALAAVQRGTIAELCLIGARLGMPAATVVWTLRRGDLLRFWRRPRPLASLAESA